MFGVYVNEDGCIPYAKLIVSGRKKIETRGKNVFKSMFGDYVQKDVAIIRTRNGKNPRIIGYCTLNAGYFCPAERFNDPDVFNLHCVPPDSKYACHGNGKWFYDIYDAIEIEPIELTNDMIIKNHGRSYAEIRGI